MSHKTFLLTRASGAEMNAAQFGNLSTMFASTAASKSTFTLLVTKEDGAIRDYLHLDETAVPGNAHLTLANALGASPEPAQLPDHIDQATVLGHATFDSAATSRDTQYGAENADFARAMAPVIGEGEWVAVTARAASKKEGAHHLKWLSHRMGTARPTHHSLSTNPLVVSVRAGAETGGCVARSGGQVLWIGQEGTHFPDKVIRVEIDTREVAKVPEVVTAALTTALRRAA
ncbi:hypothetical protein [Kocuria rhizosphaericola]|uniref:hypothetical protein n=1 Tax=Kocuria rhizosphaericola TaxID=3376284 RepID=UPI0037A65E96